MYMCLFEPLVMAQLVRRLSEAEQAACAPQLCDAFYLGKAKARQGKLLISDTGGQLWLMRDYCDGRSQMGCDQSHTGCKAMAMLVLVRERGWGVRLWLLRAHSCAALDFSTRRCRQIVRR